MLFLFPISPAGRSTSLLVSNRIWWWTATVRSQTVGLSPPPSSFTTSSPIRTLLPKYVQVSSTRTGCVEGLENEFVSCAFSCSMTVPFCEASWSAAPTWPGVPTLRAVTRSCVRRTLVAWAPAPSAAGLPVSAVTSQRYIWLILMLKSSKNSCYIETCWDYVQVIFHFKINKKSNKKLNSRKFGIVKINLFLWCKAEFSASILQSSMSHDPSEIILICWFAAQILPIQLLLVLNYQYWILLLLKICCCLIFLWTVFFSGLFNE